MENIEIEFDFEISDWMEFQQNYLKNSKQFKRTKFIFTLIAPVVFIIFIFFDIIELKFDWSSLIYYSFFALLWILIAPKYLTKRTIARSKKMIEEGDNSGVLGKRILTLSDDNIMCVTPDSKMETKWSGIKKLEETDDYYFLYVTTISAVIIPKKKIQPQLIEVDGIIKSKTNFI
jgi:YcxB-like protein